MPIRKDPAPATLSVDREEFSVVPLANSGHELAYWLAQTPDERLLAIETQRTLVYGPPKTTAGLQRVFEVAQRTRR